MPSDKTLEQKLLENLGALCGKISRIAIEAGKITDKYADEPLEMGVDIKSDDSPVTKADREAEIYIQKELEAICPNVPVIGEEAVALGNHQKDLSDEDYFWLVDPLDGTKEFISGGSDYTTNIALIHDGVPILGAIYVPALGILYSGYKDGGAKKWSQDSDAEKSISVRPVPKDGMTVVASLSHGSAEKREAFLERFKVKKMVKRGSSLKICVIAEGRADIYPRFGPTCEWDTAAGDAILRAAGGIMTDTEGQVLKYGGANPRFLNPEFIACSFEWFVEEDAA